MSKYVAHILWKHVIWFGMNFMRIKYFKEFMKDYNIVFKHCKNFYFWGDFLNIYLHNNIMWCLFKSFFKWVFFNLQMRIFWKYFRINNHPKWQVWLSYFVCTKLIMLITMDLIKFVSKTISLLKLKPFLFNVY